MSHEVNAEFDIGDSDEDIGDSDEDNVDELIQWEECLVEPQANESQPGLEFIPDDDFTL